MTEQSGSLTQFSKTLNCFDQSIKKKLVSECYNYALLFDSFRGRHMFVLVSVVPVMDYVVTRANCALVAGLDCNCGLVYNYMIQGFMQDQIIASHTFWWTHGC